MHSDAPTRSPLPRAAKYMILPLVIPACGFTFMSILAPLTSGAHAGGLPGMAIGLLVGQVIFAFVLLDRLRVPSALAIWLLASVLTWTAIPMLAGAALDDPYDTRSQAWWGTVFFVFYLAVSALLWEAAYRLTLVRAR